MHRTTEYLEDWEEAVDAFFRHPHGRALVNGQPAGHEKVLRKLMVALVPSDGRGLDRDMCEYWREAGTAEAKGLLRKIWSESGDGGRVFDAVCFSLLALALGNIKSVQDLYGFLPGSSRDSSAFPAERPTSPEVYDIEALKVLMSPGAIVPKDVSGLIRKNQRPSGIHAVRLVPEGDCGDEKIPQAG